jgi:hypothetical protein
MTVEDFRRIALSFPDTAENAHMNHPDFRVKGKIFATLPNPEDGWAMVKLPPQQQEVFVQMAPSVFVPVNGAWGRQGATRVRLKAVTEETLRGALSVAWQNTSHGLKTSKKKRR